MAGSHKASDHSERPARVPNREDHWPDGTSLDDRQCWICAAPTIYRHCKIVCTVCGFTRDCSDP